MSNRRERFARLLAQERLEPPTDEENRYLWQIVDEGVLGASRHVALTLELFQHVLDRFDGDRALPRIRLAGRTIASTRGADAPVIANVVAWLLTGLEDHAHAERPEVLRHRIAEWTTGAFERRQRLLAVGLRVLGDDVRILTFDYSSTVAELVVAAHRDGRVAGVVVPESRCIDGGRRYLNEFLETGIATEFVIDMAMDHAIARSDAVLLGVESLACDGGFLNTVGSRVIAERALAAGRPVYACTDLFKLDRTSYAGTARPPRIRDYDDLLLTEAERAAEPPVSTRAPELERVPPASYSGVISEHGLVPPTSVWALGREVFGTQSPAPAD